MRSSVAPPVKVDSRHTIEAEDSTLDPGGDLAEIGCHLVGKVGERVGVHLARQPDGAGQDEGGLADG
jgi:hypothetical protein